MKKSFYSYILTYRGGAANDAKAQFAEASFHDSSFPKMSTSFEELSQYIEMQGDDLLSASIFDELWSLYEEKYSE
ncbi:YozE family protein [Metasolibacillus sp.]|uniref:YozE family protein n=1 Tax=Metasolibacillus sp. TaxID=2703680 RepID=UPI0025D6296A|nr:YozE family protein [Metasolibacillus sp.]MCT6925927.1 YozE family protein [Metasolibacillus sp.]MCT6942152.1 YozE family protein [Metasolibacillus sp.]